MWSVLISFSFFAVFAILMRQSKLLLYIYIEWQRIFSLNEHKKDGGGVQLKMGRVPWNVENALSFYSWKQNGNDDEYSM